MTEIPNSKDELEKFGGKLTYLGGRLGFEQYRGTKKLELEEWFLEASYRVFEDERLAICLEHWIKRYLRLLDMKKVKRLILAGCKYDPATLGVFLTLGKARDSQELSSYVKAKDVLTFRSQIKVKVREKDMNLLWKSFNIACHLGEEDFKKWLYNEEFVRKHCYEINERYERLFSSLDPDSPASKTNDISKKRRQQ